jgi:hypothetical protein
MVPRSAAAVELFTSGPPQRPHADIALLEATPSPRENDVPSLLARMRETAAQMGCDAVVVANVQTQVFEHGGGDRTTVTGTCIVYEAPAVAGP